MIISTFTYTQIDNRKLNKEPIIIIYSFWETKKKLKSKQKYLKINIFSKNLFFC